LLKGSSKYTQKAIASAMLLPGVSDSESLQQSLVRYEQGDFLPAFEHEQMKQAATLLRQG